MKIVHSLWTRPWGGYSGCKYAACRFATTQAHWGCWAYSCLTAKKHYGRIELVTDSDGARIMDSLRLPYDRVTTELDEIESSVNPELWAFGKIMAYSVQTEPFIHLDGDAYFFARMPGLDDADIIVQNLEWMNNIDFDKAYPMSDVVATLPYRIEGWDKYVKDNTAYCMGIFGGNRIDLIQEYACEVICMVEGSDNADFWKNFKRDANGLNVSLEQQAAYCFFKNRGVKPTSYLAKEEWATRFQKKELCHLMARKSSEGTCAIFMSRLQSEYPSAYERVLELFP